MMVSKELVDIAENLWMWCPKRNIHITAQHLPGVQNQIADVESRTMMDRSDWRLNPFFFQEDCQPLWSIEVDLFAPCLTTQCQAVGSQIHMQTQQMHLQDWSQIQGYANPPWCMIGRVLSLIPGPSTAGTYYSSGASVEDTTMVPTPSAVTHCTSSSDHSRSDNVVSGHSESSPPASRVAYLRERYRDQELSEEATSLVLKSWRTKTNRSYDSLFREWHSWCHTRGSNPFSGPIRGSA